MEQFERFNEEKLPREKVFRDPIHGQIIVDNQIIMSFSGSDGSSSWAPPRSPFTGPSTPALATA